MSAGGPYDGAVTTHCARTYCSPSGRGSVLLVLLVLAGILGMHALGPAPAVAPTAQGHHAAAGAHGTAAGASAAVRAGDCSHSEDGTGHLSHADATCAAAGVAAAYAPPALTEALAGLAPSSATAPGAPASVARDRAPPDLAELQLLRI